jgi:phenylpropionate dioxygenase-like ring-hydroxylating dioxygenase large terminal subunit
MKTDEQASPTRGPYGQDDAPASGSVSRLDRHDAPGQIDYPSSWYYFGSEKELQRGPLAKELLGRRLVGFITGSGRPGVLSSRCVHMGSDLGGGCVVGETLQCSLHHWQFGPDGRCTHIPASDQIPSFASQNSFPAAIRHGCLYFFLGAEPRFPLPFFEGLEPEEFVVAKPFIEYVQCPWYMIGANAVDVQHFAIAHDRRMKCAPEVHHPNANVHRTICNFEVAGNSLGDRITKRFGGADVRLQVTDWSSTMILARSTLAKTETFGIISPVPLGPNRTMAHVTVMARASSGVLRRKLLDPFRSRVRRLLIRKFLRSDVDRLTGADYSPHTLIDIDQQFSEYFDWLNGLRSHRTES